MTNLLSPEEIKRLEEARQLMRRGEKWLEHVDDDDVVWIKVVKGWLEEPLIDSFEYT